MHSASGKSLINTATTVTTTTALDKFDRFEAWLRANGARFEQLKLILSSHSPISADIPQQLFYAADTDGQLELRSYDCETPQPSSALVPANGVVSSINGMMMDYEAWEEKKEPSNNHNNYVAEESEMRGVHAVTHIPPNTVCMSIPRRCLITVEMGQATAIGQAVLQSDLDLDAPKHIFLMIYILWDRKVNGAASFFFPYYEILPQTLHNMPIFWSDEELDELQGSFLLNQIADRNQAIAEDYNAICTVAPSLRHLCTLDEFKWARMCVCSRNFGLQIDGYRTSALVPHADMLNHYRPRETKWTFDEERQAFTITTLQYVVAGAEVLDSYGQKCNHRFLLNYGFAVEDNREVDGFCPNEVPLDLMIAPTDACWAEKMEFWMRGEPQQLPALEHAATAAAAMKRVRVCVSNNENTRFLFGLLRIMACTPEEMRAVSQPGYHLLASTTTGATGRASLFGVSDAVRHYSYANTISQLQQQQPPPAAVLTVSPTPVGAACHRSCRDIRHPLSLRNEQHSLRILLDMVQYQMSRYPTTLAHDHAALRDETAYPKFSNRRHAKIQVRGEKEVLHHFALWAQTALDVLDVIEAELAEEAALGVGGSLAAAEAGGGGTFEVRWRPNLGPNHVTISEGQQPPVPSFDVLIRRMEEEDDGDGNGTHHTILRYCADVLGSLRREEFRILRRRLPLQQPRSRSLAAPRGNAVGFARSVGTSSGNGNGAGGYIKDK